MFMVLLKLSVVMEVCKGGDSLSHYLCSCKTDLNLCSETLAGIDAVDQPLHASKCWCTKGEKTHRERQTDTESVFVLQAALLNGYKHNLLRQQTQIDDKYAVVTPKSLCQHCNKRIGSQPALLTPDRKIMHEHCWQELEARRKAAEARGPGPILMGRPFGAPVPMPFPLPKW